MIDNLEGGVISLTHSYRVGELVRQVGHETIYEGVQEPFERPIFIHVYDFSRGDDLTRRELTARQLRAAERSREVESFGVLLIVDHGELEDGLPFLISERCQGPTLEEVLEREGTLAPEEVARLILRLSELIDPFHRRLRYHASVTPSWIALPEQELSAARLGHAHLTLSLDELRSIGSSLPHDLLSERAPELLEQEAPSGSRAADLYALGVIAYRCLCGAHPVLSERLGGEEAIEALLASSPRPLQELGVDAELSQVVMRALERSPDQRWASAPAFAQALARAVGLFEPPEARGARLSPSSSDQRADESDQRVLSRGLEERAVTAGDRHALIAGASLLALLATNGFWLIWVLALPASGSGSGDEARFTTLEISSDEPALKVIDASRAEHPPSPLGATPLKFDLPRSEEPLQLEITSPEPLTRSVLKLEFLQTSQPLLKLSITRDEAPTE